MTDSLIQIKKNVYGSNLLKRPAGSDTYLYMYNGHGDVTTLMSQSGSIAVQYYYDAFGVITEETAQVSNPYRYSGYEFDETFDELEKRYQDGTGDRNAEV